MLHRTPERARTWGGEPRVESEPEPVFKRHELKAVANGSGDRDGYPNDRYTVYLLSFRETHFLYAIGKVRPEAVFPTPSTGLSGGFLKVKRFSKNIDK